MIKSPTLLISVFCLVLLTWINTTSAQSIVIQVDRQPIASYGSRIVQKAPEKLNIPSTLSTRQQNWERILETKVETPFDDQTEYEFGKVMEWLLDIGVPIALDSSALDDLLSLDEPFVLELPGRRLFYRLQFSLRKLNATLTMDDHLMKIVSLDVVSDPEYFSTVTYDIGSLNIGNYDNLIELITATVDPENWVDTNGDAWIRKMTLNGRVAFTLSAPYSTHRKMQTFILGLDRLGDRIAISGEYRMKSPLVSSQIVELPGAPEKRKRKSRIGKGIGGFGLGGGVF